MGSGPPSKRWVGGLGTPPPVQGAKRPKKIFGLFSFIFGLTQNFILTTGVVLTPLQKLGPGDPPPLDSPVIKPWGVSRGKFGGGKFGGVKLGIEKLGGGGKPIGIPLPG